MRLFLQKHLFPVLHKRAVRRSFFGFAILLLLFSVFGYFILPGIIQSQTEKLISEKLHRQATIGAVEVNPYALTVTMRDVKLMEPEGGAVFAAFDTLKIDLSSESLLRLAPVVQQLHLTKPSVRLVRKSANQYNIDDIVALIAAQPPSTEPARFSVNNIQLKNGRIEFDDRPAGKMHAVADLELGVPFISSLPSQVQIFVEPLLSANVNGTPLLIKGKARPFADPKDAVVELNLNDLDLTRYLAYLPFKPQFKVSGARLDAHLTASFRQQSGKAPALALSGDAALKAVQVTDLEGKPVLKLPQLTAAWRDMDVFGSRFELARVALNGLEADVTRDSDGALSLTRLLSAGSTPATAAPTTSAPTLALAELQIRGATLRYADENPVRPMRAGVEKLDLAVRDVAVDMRRRKVQVGEVASDRASLLLQQNKSVSQAASAADAPGVAPAATGAAYTVDIGRINIDNWSARLEDRSQAQTAVTVVEPLNISMQRLSTAASSPGRIDAKATVNKTGRLAVSGSLGFAPLYTDIAIDVKNVDILPLQPYITDKVNLRLTRASVSADGRLQLDSGKDGMLQGGFKGNVNLGNLTTVDKISGSSFLRWKSLSLGGLDVRLQPFSLAADEVALNDFFARVIIDPSGRINLQDIARSHPGERKSLTDGTAGASAAPVPAGGNARPTAAQTAMPPIRIRKLSLQGGTVRFTDNFIKPNYSASLANFGGVVSGLSSDPASSASMDLHGEVNSAPLVVAGRINPLKGDLFLDLKAKVRGMELAPLSAYSGRYVGYGIEKGKLSFDVTYHVDNRTLSAENRLILEQLTFGDKVESSSAADLPVRFAVALLSDRNGVIDINLPVGGSLDDPQFSIGAIIFKAIGNAIVKVVTQPFALLGSLFGGGEELSSLAFDPGRSAISDAGAEKLGSLAKALADRPALKLEITGRVDPEADRAGLKRVSIERKVRMLKVRDLAERGATVKPGSVTVSDAEYPALLARVYKDEKFEKPRNLIGLQKDLPVAEMEKLMIDNTDISEDDLIALGNQRAQAAKSWLMKNGQVPDERIFILASKLGNRDAKGEAGQSSNKVDFSLR